MELRARQLPKVLQKAQEAATQESRGNGAPYVIAQAAEKAPWDKAPWDKGPWDKGHWANRK